MRMYFSRILTLSMVIVSTLSLSPGCTLFQGKALETELVKPQPIGGYEALSTRIHYPISIREQGTEGNVLIKAFITSDGFVAEARVAEKLDPELDKIAANAVKRTLFEPALRDGTPVDVWISIPIVFALKNWDPQISPFDTFEMLVEPSPAYKSFKVRMHGQIKNDQELPIRFELLLPLNADKTWVKSGGETIAVTRVLDESGEWLIFQAEQTMLELGFDYRPFSEHVEPTFQYRFTINQTLPPWDLIVVYGDQKVNFSQDPTSITEQADGSLQVLYELKSQEAYEMRYLEVSLAK